jgi:hypothetical protein
VAVGIAAILHPVGALNRPAPHRARTVIPEMAPARAPGSDGTISVGGWLLDAGEKRAELRGATRWVTYDNLIANIAILYVAGFRL